MRFLVWILPVICVVVAVAAAAAAAEGEGDTVAPAPTAVEVAGKIFDSCARFGSFSCVKPKLLKFLRASLKSGRIQLTDDLSIEGDGRESSTWQELDPRKDLPLEEMSKQEESRFMLLKKIDHFLNSHSLKIKLPREIVTGEVFPFLPKYVFDSVPKEIKIPLTDANNGEEERGLAKKVILPFLLGLKIKATTFIPIAIALIALKTWKALTLGLLSTVLAAAMVIFKFAKPKVINYEVYHYPHHHSAPHADHHGYGRSQDGGQDLAYRAHRK